MDSPESKQVDLRRLFEMLSSFERQEVLLLLDERTTGPGDILSLREVLEECGDSSHLEVGMFHCHLPKLDEAEYVDWDRDRGTIRRGPRFDQVTSMLAHLEEEHDVRSGPDL
jgi:hypothetical protein